MTDGKKPERRVLPPFPVDEATLSNIKHALGGSYTVDEDGTHHLVGSEFTLSQLLDFLSGYDESKLIVLDPGYEVPENASFGEKVAGASITEYPDPIYHYFDVIRALIEEVERLRALHPDE